MSQDKKVLNEKVSVIIPTYNRAKYVIEALESVLNQTYKNYEIVIVDDGSTDNTREVLRQYLADDRITYIYEKNGGPASARNVGIKHSTGEHIAFLDSDDLWLPDKLVYQVEYLKTHCDVGIVFTDAKAFGEDLGPVNAARAEFRFRFHNPSFKLLMWGNYMPTPTVMLRRACIDKVGCFDESSDLRIGGEDYELWLRIARVFKIGHLDQVLVKIRFSQDSLLGINLDKSFDVELNTISRIIRHYPTIPDEIGETRRQILARIYFKYGQIDLKAGNYQGARNKFAKAFGFQPFSWKTIKYYLRATYKEKRSFFKTAMENL